MHIFIPIWLIYTLLTGGAYYAGKTGVGAQTAQSLLTTVEGAASTNVPAATPAK